MITKDSDIVKVEITVETLDGKKETFKPINYAVLFEGEILGELGLIGAVDIINKEIGNLMLIQLEKTVDRIKRKLESDSHDLFMNVLWSFEYFMNQDVEGFKKDPRYEELDTLVAIAIEEAIKERR